MATGDKIFVPTQAEVANSTPVGTVAAFSIATAPSGFMECDGAAISRTTYSALFAVIGESYGVGDGSTTFNIPDLRGEFIRGFDNGKGTDSGRAIASSQADDNKSHTHTANHNHTGSTNSTGSHTHNAIYRDGLAGSYTSFDLLTTAEILRLESSIIQSSGSHSHTVTVDTKTMDTGANGGAETRPRNIAMMYCIKY